MKKIIPITLLAAILLTGNIAFVQGSTLTNVKSSITQARADYNSRLAEITPLLELVRTNRTEILALKEKSSDAYNKAKYHIKELIKNKDNLTPTQIESLKEALNVLQQDKQTLASTIGEIGKETLSLRAGKRDKNFEEVKSSLTSIINIQNSRIEDLKRIIDDISKAAAE